MKRIIFSYAQTLQAHNAQYGQFIEYRGTLYKIIGALDCGVLCGKYDKITQTMHKPTAITTSDYELNPNVRTVLAYGLHVAFYK